jgi:uncharacterized membrane protein
MFSNLFPAKKEHIWTLILLAVSSVAGLLAAFVLSTGAIELAKNANAVLPCSLNAALNCATVGAHPSASIFGFPNAFIGMITMPVMLTIAIAALMGTKFPRSFLLMAELGAAAGVLFAVWMFYVSYTVIQVLCPWCLTTDIAMVVLFIALTRYNILEGNLYLNKRMDVAARRFVSQGFDILVGLLVLVVAAALIIIKFGQILFT